MPFLFLRRKNNTKAQIKKINKTKLPGLKSFKERWKKLTPHDSNDRKTQS